jgi:Carboxypeptidase regulatory-like domain
MSQKTISSLSWRPIPLRLVPGPSRRSYGLGQSQMRPLVVEVVDITGNPVNGATVEIAGSGPNGTTANIVTDKKGQAVANVAPGNYTLRATYNDLVIVKKISQEEMLSGATAFLQFPVCIHGPLFRPIDLAIFGAAASMIVAGSHFKVKALEMTGEIALGAAIFGFIYRLQCI